MSSHNALLAGTRKGLLLFERNGNGWHATAQWFGGQPVSYSMHDPRTNTLWACLDHGHWGQKLHRSRDWGTTWEEVKAPAYPEGAEIKAGTPATLRYIWSIGAGGTDRPNTVFLGTEPGGLFRSDDGGDSFTLVDSLWNHPSRQESWFGGGRDYAGIHSIITDPRDSNRQLIGISCAGVFETTDDGATWAPINKGLRADYLPNPDVEVGHDPHLLAMAPNNPDVLWQQNHCGIFRSTDGGRQWEQVSTEGNDAHFGFAIAVDERNPDRAWVVPAQSDGARMAIGGALRVCRTDDGGRTWTTFTNGLPQQTCFDVVYRHALDVSGDTLAFASTTGNMFISEDGGNSWHEQANYLPPVYSLRFASRG
ncbi:MAG: glycosyl hydrolase [Bacteroidetes bacterium]|nr:glycosyl hydrolase [Bacteroidota bacterium]